MWPSRLVGTLGVLALWGCSQSIAPGNTISDQQITADVAASAAPAVATSASGFLSAGIGSGASTAGTSRARVLGASVVPATTSCTTHSASDVLTFSPESHPDSIAFTRTWEFFSDAGCQNAFDAASTDSIAFTASLVEVDNDPRFVARATRVWQLDVTGVPTLAGAATHVWNGTGTDADTATHATPGLHRTYIGAAHDTATNVTFPHPLNGVTVPTSGTFSRWTSVTVTMTTKGVHKVRTVARHIVVTFNGTTDVPLVVFDEMAGARLLTCTLDLTARRIVDGSCH